MNPEEKWKQKEQMEEEQENIAKQLTKRQAHKLSSKPKCKQWNSVAIELWSVIETEVM